MKNFSNVFFQLCDRLMMLIGTCVGFQIPLFMQQYMYRLLGHLEELNFLIGQLEQSAQITQKSLKQYINKFLINQDTDIVLQGHFMEEIVNRADALNKAWLDWNESSIWSRPFYFIKNLQPSIFESTWNDFQPGLSFNAESIIYAFIGAVVGILCWQFILYVFRKLFKRRVA